MTIGILSLPVSNPSDWENLEILRRWSLMCPLSASSRTQLMTISCRLRCRPS